jgi:signal transduction histidine kinase
MRSQPATDAAAMSSRLRLMARVRWLAVAFGLGQILGYSMQEYPPGIREWAIVTVVVLALGNIGLALAVRGGRGVSGSGLAIASLVLDGLVASALTWLYSFDPVSALFAILFIIPIEGAVFFQLRGAMISWAALSVLYTGREIFAVRYDNPFEVPSLTFRVGMLGIISFTVGMLTRRLAEEHAASRQALAELRRADEWRSRLVAMLAHDVRSPLGAIEGLARTVRDNVEALPVDTIRDLSDRVVTRTAHLQALSSDLLDLARQDHEELQLRRTEVNLGEMVAEVVREGGAAGQVVVDVPRDLVVSVDAARFEQVLANLLANAHRYGAPPIAITAEAAGDAVEVTVRDHGPGVPAEILSGLFDPFVHGEDRHAVGLGLWIVRRLVEAHGGVVAYRAADPGAVFTITLPGAVVAVGAGSGAPQAERR